MLETPLDFMGMPGSPYSRKMRALLRYRNIPNRMHFQGSRSLEGRPQARVPLLPTFYLPDERGEVQAVTDSTPLLRRFEEEFEGRSVRPDDPAVALLDSLLEDFADEWLTKPMFHYRWAFQADIDQAAAILPLWRKVDVPDSAVKPFSKTIAERQISRLGVVGSNEVTGPIIEQSYREFLALLDAHLQAHPYLLGTRPSACDFAIYGQLTQLALFDPTPRAVTLEVAPRVYAWVEHVEDLSGLEPGEWLDAGAPPETLRALFAHVGRTYVPVMLANERAVAAGAEQVEGEVYGKPWTQRPFPYQAKCLGWVRDEYAALAGTGRARVDAVLAGSGCEALFARGDA